MKGRGVQKYLMSGLTPWGHVLENFQAKLVWDFEYN